MSIEKYIIAAAIAFNSTIVQAGAGGGGKITQLIPVNNGVLSFIYSGAHSSPPTCGSPYLDHWAIDASGAAGQVLAASAITAFSTGATVYIQGTGTCYPIQSD